MEITGRNEIPAPRPVVWRALNDPEVLRRCMPGCESLKKISDVAYNATISTKVGPVKAKFTGGVTLTDVHAPYSYTIVGEGKAGSLGIAKGNVKVCLECVGDATVLTYGAEAALGGKLAQLGSRVVSAAAREMADQFFASFVMEFVQPATGEAAAMPRSAIGSTSTKTAGYDSAATPVVRPSRMPDHGGVSAWAWAGIAVAAIIAFGIIVSVMSGQG